MFQLCFRQVRNERRIMRVEQVEKHFTTESKMAVIYAYIPTHVECLASVHTRQLCG